MKLEQYVNRKIVYEGLIKRKEWRIKTYSITLNNPFQNTNIIQEVQDQLDLFLSQTDVNPLVHYKIGFLVIHEGREGVWVLFNWWSDGEIIQSKVYLVDYESPSIINKSPFGDNVVCIWELEVFIHERSAWIEHVLKNSQNPDIEDYLNNHLSS